MYRQLLRQEPEVIAVMARNEVRFLQWQRENDFHNTDNIKWQYIRGKYSIMGIRFTMLFLIDDWYRGIDAGNLVELVHRNLDRDVGRMRTFTTEEMWKSKHRYRKEGQTATGGSLPFLLSQPLRYL